MRAGSLAFAALLAGCTVGPDYLRPAVEVPAAWRYEDKEARDLADTAWWEQFRDPVLDDMIREALRENQDLHTAVARVEEFVGRLATTRSALFPQVNYQGAAGRQRVTTRGGPIPLTPGVDPKFSSYQADLSASWEIDLFGRLRRSTEAAQADLLATEEARRGVILTLVSSVATAYINLRDLDKQLEISRRTLDTRAGALQLFDLRFKGGVISELEVAQIRSEYETAAAAIPSLEQAIAQQEHSLTVLLGRNPGPVVRGNDLDALALPAVPEGLPSTLLERRPDVVQAEQNLVAANARIGAARALYFPAISLTGLLGGASTQLSELFQGPARTWSYAGTVVGPIFTAGGIAGTVQQAEAQQQQFLFQYRKAIQSAFQEVEDALVANRKLREQLEAQGRQVAALHDYARLARLRYDNGYTSYLEVLDAERSLFSAELAYTQTQGAVLANLVNLYRAMGGGWVAEADRLSATN